MRTQWKPRGPWNKTGPSRAPRRTKGDHDARQKGAHSVRSRSPVGQHSAPRKNFDSGEHGGGLQERVGYPSTRVHKGRKMLMKKFQELWQAGLLLRTCLLWPGFPPFEPSPGIPQRSERPNPYRGRTRPRAPILHPLWSCSAQMGIIVYPCRISTDGLDLSDFL